jgi:tRNA A-37 threonylcarbamoyl transferase component Bud32
MISPEPLTTGRSTRTPSPGGPPTPAPGPERLFEPPGWDWSQTGDVGWWVRPGWRSALLGPSGLRLEQWRRQGRLTTVKTGPHRVVYRVDLDEGSVYIKHFLVPGWRAKLRQWFRRGKGRNEGRRAVTLAAIGVPTITPIALGEQRKRKFLLENYLITPAIPATVPLDEFVERRLPELPGPRGARIRQRLAVALAELTARLHDAGLVHGDFHPGNVLVHLDDADRPALAMIDLDALRVRTALSWSGARDNLALLNHYFWLRCGRSDRQRFLRAYLDARRREPPDPAGFARGIEASTRAWAERLWRRWGRRCLGTNKYFKTYRGPPLLGRRLARPGPGDGPRAPGRHRRAPGTPRHDPGQAVAHHDRRRADPAGRGPADPRHLQAVQPQEVVRPGLGRVPAVAGLARLAGRPAPGQPRGARPRATWPCWAAAAPRRNASPSGGPPWRRT